MAETHGERLALHEGEFIGGVVAGDGEMVFRGAEVLADGEDVDADAGEVAVDRKEFAHFFAKRPTMTPDFVTTAGLISLASWRRRRVRS